MKKIIFSLLVVVLTSACSKENPELNPTNKAENFITINECTIDLDATDIYFNIDYDEYNNIGTLKLEAQRVLYAEKHTSNNVITTKVSSDRRIYWEMSYNLFTTNEKTDIRKAIELYGEIIDIKETIIESQGVGYGERDLNNINDIGFIFEEGIGETCSIKNVPLNDVKKCSVNDYIETGWYLVQEISSHKKCFSGEFTTHNGFIVKFSFVDEPRPLTFIEK